MPTPASIAKHPIHPMLVVFPIALFVFAFLCDIAFLMTADRRYSTVAYYCIAGGIVGGVLAAVPGFIDYASLRGPEVKRKGRLHMLLNLAAVALFAVNFYLRTEPGRDMTDASMTLPFALSLVGVGLLGASGWLGGEMVYVHGVGVEKDAPHSYDSR